MSYVSSLAINIQTLKIFREEETRIERGNENGIIKWNLQARRLGQKLKERRSYSFPLSKIVRRDLEGWLVTSRLLYQGWRNRNALLCSLTARVARSNGVEKRGHDDRFAGNNSGLLLRACLKVWSRSRQRMGRRNTTKRWLGQKGVEVRLGVPSGWKLAYLDGRLEILADKRYSLASDR